MRYADLFLITEAQRRAEAFEHDVENAQLLAQGRKGKNWRYRTAELLLHVAARLEPQPKRPRTTTPC